MTLTRATAAAVVLLALTGAPALAGPQAAVPELEAWYAEHPPRAGWTIAEIEARPESGRAVVTADVPAKQAQALMAQTHMIRYATFGGNLCPNAGSAPWQALASEETIVVQGRQDGRVFIRVDCRRLDG
jgi:hypothetical protein